MPLPRTPKMKSLARSVGHSRSEVSKRHTLKIATVLAGEANNCRHLAAREDPVPWSLLHHSLLSELIRSGQGRKSHSHSTMIEGAQFGICITKFGLLTQLN
ncbi:ATPase [Platysternon megacephalum]|uniref:ATPase n=1 Tax=Platysternon megacephalum TaxID=55544 RepID=A0A4D9DNM2_9SAUR|nr:ATPase [Platysternon megacephalum]